MPFTQSPSKHHLLRTLALFVFTALFIVIASPVLAASGGDSDRSWGAFFGRTHVLFLHLPIGLIIGAFTIEVFGFFKRSKGFDVAAAWLFVLGAGASIVAVITGMLLGTEVAGPQKDTGETLSIFQLLFADSTDQGVSETMGWHMWLGITLMVAAIVAAVLKVIAVRRQWRDAESAIPERGGWPLGVSRLAMIGSMTALPFAGHLGGNMTHGQQYLTDRAPFDVPEWMVAWPEVVEEDDGDDVVVGTSTKPDGSVASWVNVIQPAINNSCIKCHGPSKQNADIRLDTLKYATEGEGLDYPVITAGDAQYSSLYEVITLPQSHDMYMPPDPKKALTVEMVSFIGEWLQEYDGRLEDPEPVKPDPAGPEGQGEPVIAKPVIDSAAIAAAGGSAQSLSQEENADQLTVKFAYLKELSPETVAKLETGADKIVWLTFEGSSFGDEAAKALPAMPALTKLNLKDSAITDAGLAELPDLFSLSWLNLFGTNITDAGLDSLKKYDLLEKLYLTGTMVTAEGVEALRKAMPDTEIFSDHDGQFQFTPVTPEVKPGDPAKDDKAAAATDAKPVNTVCPVGGVPIKPGFVSTFEGKTVGFCCGGCKGKFDADPKKFAAKLK